MRIADVRTLLKTYSKAQLQLIIAEMYKAIPKAIRNYCEDKAEVKLYIVLQWLYSSGQPEYFAQEYQKAVHAEVRPRQQLVTVFEAIQATGDFPESFY